MRPQIIEYLSSYGICVYVPDYYAIYLSMIVLDLLFSTRHAVKYGYTGKHFFLITCSIILFSIVGARLYGILLDLRNYQYLPSLAPLFLDRKTGSMGAYIGGLIGTIVVTKFNKLDTLKILDIYAPYIALSIFFGRIGCYMSGCCYGKISSVPWTVSYPRGSIVFLKQQIAGLLSPYVDHSLPVHPTQLYESLFGVILFLFLIWISEKSIKKGFSISFFFAAYCSFRFFIEFLRGDNYNFVSHFSLAQLLSFIGFGLSLINLLHIKIRTTKSLVKNWDSTTKE